MVLIPDDPVIRSMERTGYPPWYRVTWNEDPDEDGKGEDYDDWEGEYGDVYYGSETSSF